MYGASVDVRLMGAATSSALPGVGKLSARAGGPVPGVEQAIDRIAAPAGSEDATLMMARVQQHNGLASYMVLARNSAPATTTNNSTLMRT